MSEKIKKSSKNLNTQLENGEKVIKSYTRMQFVENAKGKRTAVGNMKLTVTNKRLVCKSIEGAGMSSHEYPIENIYGVNYTYQPFIKKKKIFSFIFLAIFALLTICSVFVLPNFNWKLLDEILKFGISVHSRMISYVFMGIFGCLTLICFASVSIRQRDNSNFSLEITFFNPNLNSFIIGQQPELYTKKAKLKHMPQHLIMQADKECLKIVNELDNLFKELRKRSYIS